MPKTLRLVHDEHFDLLSSEDAPEGSVSLGDFTVLTKNGEETREKHRFAVADNFTSIDLPDDYDSNDLQALTHLIQTLVERHSDKVTSVSGSDPALTAKVAALLGATVVDGPVDNAETAPEVTA